MRYVIDFADVKISRSAFDLDYSSYCTEHFPYFETEHACLTVRFTNTVDVTCDAVSRMDDKSFRDAIADTLDVFLYPNSALQ